MTADTTSSILIVDDIMENLQVAADILRVEFPDLAFANSGPEALDILAEGGIDLVLLDVMMPEMNGFEVCRLLKKDRNLCDIPVIFLTAKTDPESLLEGFESGAVDYIHKPFNAAELLVRVRTHLRLRRTEIGLRRMLAEKDRFLDIVTHQIDGPFNGLREMLRMMERELDTLPREELAEDLALSVQTSDMVGELLRNLATWSKLQTGGFGLRPRPLPLLELIQGLARLHEGEMAVKGLRLELAIDPALAIRADPEVASRALEGLFSNAVKFSLKDGVVTVAAEVKGVEVHIAIQDRGYGIAAGRIPGLFDPLNQPQNPEPPGKTGGLGLPLARALIEHNGGALIIESTVGEGTTARVRLPLARGE